MPRGPKKPTPEQMRLIEAMAASGMTCEQIAEAMQMHPDTLRKYAGQIIRKAKILAEAKMSQSLYKKGINGHFPAQKYWLQTQGGPQWRVNDPLAEKIIKKLGLDQEGLD